MTKLTKVEMELFNGLITAVIDARDMIKFAHDKLEHALQEAEKEEPEEQQERGREEIHLLAGEEIGFFVYRLDEMRDWGDELEKLKSKYNLEVMDDPAAPNR